MVGYDHTIYKLSFPATKSLAGEEEVWKGVTLFVSDDGENYKPIANVNKEPTCGYIVEFNNGAYCVSIIHW